MREPTDAPELAPDPRVLGQLLLVQSTVNVMPQAAGMSELVCRGLTAVPGAESVAVCLGGEIAGRSERFPALPAAADPSPGCAPDSGCIWRSARPASHFRLQTVNRTFGCLAFVLDSPERFAPYLPHIQNTANILAMTLENREQHARLRDLNEDLRDQVLREQQAEAALQEIRRGLEETVAERTAALVALNEELAAEVRERRLAQDATAWEAALSSAAAEVARAMLEALDLREISSIVLDRGRQLTGSALGKVNPFDAAAGEGVPPSRAAAVLSNQVGPDPLWEELFEGSRVDRLLRVPAVAGQKVVGELCLANPRRDYTEKDLQLVQRLAELYALAVEREREAGERRQLGEQIQRAQRLEAVGVLAGGVAHDFRNLLQIIQAHLDLVLAGSGGTPSEALREIARAIERAAEITDQLLAFSRTAEVRARPLDLNEVAQAVTRLMDHTLPKMIRYELHLAVNLPHVHGDSGQLEQVVLNLVVNARDAMDTGGVLRVATERTTAEAEEQSTRVRLSPGDYVALRVSDTGHGMDEETQSKVFDPFFTTKPVGRGTGLGLSVAYGIVKAHGGYIGCASVPGRGSTFSILLPAAAGAPALAAGALQPAPAAARENETVLLVDDEQSILVAMVVVLHKQGYRTLTASSGESALDVYRQQGPRIDAVVLDLGMPGMGGEACLKEILKLNPDAKVIVSSGYATTGGAEMGAAAYLSKPYRLASLLEALRRVLDAPAGRRA